MPLTTSPLQRRVLISSMLLLTKRIFILSQVITRRDGKHAMPSLLKRMAHTRLVWFIPRIPIPTTARTPYILRIFALKPRLILIAPHTSIDSLLQNPTASARTVNMHLFGLARTDIITLIQQTVLFFLPTLWVIPDSQAIVQLTI